MGNVRTLLNDVVWLLVPRDRTIIAIVYSVERMVPYRAIIYPIVSTHTYVRVPYRGTSYLVWVIIKLEIDNYSLNDELSLNEPRKRPPTPAAAAPPF